MTAVGVSLQEQRGWTAISAAGLHVLVRWDAAAPGLARLRDAAASGDLDEVLDALTREGVRRAPDFAAVQEGAPARVVARGTAYAVVSAPAGETELRAAARGPWSDHDAPEAATSVQLRTGEEITEPEPEPVPEPQPQPVTQPVPGQPVQPTAPSAPSAPSGWRLPTRLGRGRTSSEPEPAAPAAQAPAAQTLAAEEVDELPSYDHLFGATQHGRPDPLAPEYSEPQYIEPHDTDSISEPGIGRAPIEVAGGFTPAPAHQSDLTLPPPADTERPGPRPAEPEGRRSERTSAVSTTPPEAPAPVAPPTPGGLIDSVPWRRGGSNVALPESPPAPMAAPALAPAVGSVPAAPTVRPAGVHTPPPAPTLRPTGPPATAPPPEPAPAPPLAREPEPVPEPAPPHALAAPAPATAPVPADGPAPTPPAPLRADPWSPASSPAGPDEHDDAEATVDRSALLAAAQVESGPLVLAVLCPAGHPSPPHAGTCRSCGRDIPAQQPFQTPRPPLGALRLASGDVVSLDRGVLLGRSPKVNADLPAADRPHLVRVPSPENDISRNHVEVVLEGWHVLVRDLGSTNGTTIALPGQVAVRLRPGDQQVIEPGTVITMADEVSVTFEVGG